eukprot:TRINITY_DN23712_c0_g1_i1.p1 TRINITY_DN23712_c0_g1~~TRINITY_DN23712_c0_g1_i1.p1  ORF type:complete len:630 (-),score=121.36 TRINITY_DN23712_c0_g1_i1:84-1973(-)
MAGRRYAPSLAAGLSAERFAARTALTLLGVGVRGAFAWPHREWFSHRHHTTTPEPYTAAFADDLGRAAAEAEEIAEEASTLALPLGAFLFAYGAIFGLTRFLLKPASAERERADRLLCCWKDLYRGKAFWLYNIVFAPILLMIHACRIYIAPCVAVYWKRSLWLFCGCILPYFEDKEFPPNRSSLGEVGGDTANVEAGHRKGELVWCRAMDLSRKPGEPRAAKPKLHGTNMCLFQGKIEPCDILQGALGDCWLLAAMACLAEREGAINSLFITREVNPRGRYVIRLFEPLRSAWVDVVVDDHVPVECDPRAKDEVLRNQEGLPIPRYAKPNGGEIWALILEKAFAKLCGSYAAIEGGVTEWGLAVMTGCETWRYEISDSGRWERRNLVFMPDEQDRRGCGFRGTDEVHSSHELFELLRYYHRNGAVLCCGGVKQSGTAKGLVTGHAFSLLQVCSVRKSKSSTQYFRFVQIRNPWGTGEWTGAWSDGSPEWRDHPYVQRKLGHNSSDDGLFWMQWEDFVTHWGYVGVVDMTTDILSVRPPVYPEGSSLGPLRACVEGCGRFWCCCLGVRRFLFQHEASSARVEARDFRANCGADQRGVYCRLFEHETVHVEGGRVLHDPASPTSPYEQRF